MTDSCGMCLFTPPRTAACRGTQRDSQIREALMEASREALEEAVRKASREALKEAVS